MPLRSSSLVRLLLKHEMLPILSMASKQSVTKLSIILSQKGPSFIFLKNNELNQDQPSETTMQNVNLFLLFYLKGSKKWLLSLYKVKQ